MSMAPHDENVSARSAELLAQASSPDETPTGMLVFSLAGRLGSGASFVGRNLRDELHSYRYEVEVIDVSVLIMLTLLDDEGTAAQEGEELINTLDDKLREKFPKPEERTRALQDHGNALRVDYGDSILARLAVSYGISKHLRDESGVAKRQAFIIDSLKRPEEVVYLRKVFGSAYFALGVVSTDAKRLERLRERKGYDETVFQKLSEKDRKEKGTASGQRAVDTVLKSDYFFANNFSTKDQIKPEISRFLALVFNSSMHTPRADEFAMNVAYKAAARSACLSRQVGAALVDKDGQLVATGCNDVPRFGGGLYSAEDSEDQRCWARGGKCYNDEEKSLIIAELLEAFSAEVRRNQILDQAEGLSLGKPELEQKLRDALESALKTSRIKQLVEFSRAVHAEMDAIMAVARTGKTGILGGTLYCTTYPCHNCAKHIIDVGITRLVYLEPYEKSLAKKLHADAMTDEGERNDKTLAFQLYYGVSPARYSEFFAKRQDRKSNGKYLDRSDDKSNLAPLIHESAEELWRRISKELSIANYGGESDGHDGSESQP